MKTDLIKQAEKQAKQLINKAYQCAEFSKKLILKKYNKIGNYEDDLYLTLNVINEYKIYGNLHIKSDNFSKTMHLFLEQLEEDLDIKYYDFHFNEYGAFFKYTGSYLDIQVDIFVYNKSEKCKMIEKEYTEKRYIYECE